MCKQHSPQDTSRSHRSRNGKDNWQGVRALVEALGIEQSPEKPTGFCSLLHVGLRRGPGEDSAPSEDPLRILLHQPTFGEFALHGLGCSVMDPDLKSWFLHDRVSTAFHLESGMIFLVISLYLFIPFTIPG